MTITINGTTGIAGVDGSAATPSVQGVDTNTGMFFPAADTIAFAEGGTEVMRINSSGNVGIGTTSPTGNLTIGGSSPRLDFLETGGSAGFDNTTLIRDADIFVIQTRNGSTFVSNDYRITANASGALTHEWRIANTERMRIDSSGNVGIGTTTPTCALDVTGGIQTSRTTVTSPATTDGNIFSGTYTPTLTNTTNVAASTATANQYMRVGNFVTVSGQVSIDPTTAATNTVLGMSLPIASAFTSSRQLAGSGCSYSTTKYGDNNLAIIADATNDRVEFRLNPTGAANEIYTFTFTYQVL